MVKSVRCPCPYCTFGDRARMRVDGFQPSVCWVACKGSLTVSSPLHIGKGALDQVIIVLYCIVLYCIVLYCIVLYCIGSRACEGGGPTDSSSLHIGSSAEKSQSNRFQPSACRIDNERNAHY